jgi:hypothetical protein
MHGKDFAVTDPEHSYINAAKAMAMTTIDLLAEGAVKARRLLEGYQPAMGKAEYLAFMRGISHTEVFDGGIVGRHN